MSKVLSLRRRKSLRATAPAAQSDIYAAFYEDDDPPFGWSPAASPAEKRRILEAWVERLILLLDTIDAPTEDGEEDEEDGCPFEDAIFARPASFVTEDDEEDDPEEQDDHSGTDEDGVAPTWPAEDTHA